jgi:hypothetical protein
MEANPLIFMVRPAGFEPAAYGFEVLLRYILLNSIISYFVLK